MAPRSNKTKKAAETSIESNGVTKRVKAKNIEKVNEKSTELESVQEEMPLDKKKRGKKPANDAKENTQLNGNLEKKADDINVSKEVEANNIDDNEDSVVKPEEKDNPVEKKKRGKKPANDAKENTQLNGNAEKNADDINISKEVEANNIDNNEDSVVKPEEKDNPVEKKKRGKKPSKGAKETENNKIEEIPIVEKKKRGKNINDAKAPSQEHENIENEAEDKGIPIEEKKKRGKKPPKEATHDSEHNEIEQEEKEIPIVEKKKRGKKVNNANEQESTEEKSEENIPVVEKKKRGRKVNDAKEQSQPNGDDDNELPPAKKGRKKKVEADNSEEGKGEPSEVLPSDSVQKVKATKGRRQQNNDEPIKQENEPESKKRRRKDDEDKGKVEEVKKKPLKNNSCTNYEEIDFSNFSKNSQGKEWNLKISSWNVDGIRAWMTKGGLEYLKYEKPNILCLQEVKCSNDKLPEEIANPPGYHAYWSCSEQDGYAGVGIYTTKLAMNVQYGLNDKELDNEGRIITAEYEQFYLICTYVPNAGRKLVTLPKRLQWNEAFRKYVKDLDKKKPVIICGDMNVAHNEIDLSNPKTNKKNAGFTEEERAGMSDLLGDGFVDTFRHLYPNKTQAYTFWTYMMNCRAKNVGWRLDYFIVSERLLSSLCDSVIRDQVYGSDHCPISLFLHLTSADKPKE